jgi:hypothetical protein
MGSDNVWVDIVISWKSLALSKMLQVHFYNEYYNKPNHLWMCICLSSYILVAQW